MFEIDPSALYHKTQVTIMLDQNQFEEVRDLSDRHGVPFSKLMRHLVNIALPQFRHVPITNKNLTKRALQKKLEAKKKKD